MAIHRLRARLLFSKSSGLAAWTKDQMDVRHGQAVHINPGMANEEQKKNEISDIDTDHELFVCDLPLHDLAAVQDAFATLTDHNVLGQALTDAEGGRSWVEHHTCHHDEVPPQPCQIEAKEFSPDNSTDEWQAGVDYVVGDRVMYDGTEYECLQAHTSQTGWEPPNVPALWSSEVS